LNFEVLCKRDVRSQDRDEARRSKKTPRDRLETETFETKTATLSAPIMLLGNKA